MIGPRKVEALNIQIGAVLSPDGDWAAVIDAARTADEVGLEAVGFWDHYHSPKPEWGYVSGWSAYGYLAAVTRRVRLVPMVLNALHYELGVLAKESSTLATASGGRFELAIGAGDWPESFAAWGTPYPERTVRLEMLSEKVAAVRALWRGEPVSFQGSHLRLDGATCTPAPEVAPRVVVGVGGSRRTLQAAIEYADELNVYGDAALVAEAREAIAASGRVIGLSVFLGWEFDNWPADPAADLAGWREKGVDRAFVNVGAPSMTERVRELAAAAGALESPDPRR